MSKQAKNMSHNARQRALRGKSKDAQRFKILMRNMVVATAMASDLRRSNAVLNIDIDSGLSITNPFRGNAEALK